MTERESGIHTDQFSIGNPEGIRLKCKVSWHNVLDELKQYPYQNSLRFRQFGHPTPHNWIGWKSYRKYG